MKKLSRLALLAPLAALSLGGCNLTYDREGLAFEEGTPPPPPVVRDAEPNDTMPTATAVTLGVDVAGTLGSVTDVDFYKFTVPAGGLEVHFATWDASGSACEGIDVQIAVYDGTTQLGFKDDSRGYCEDLFLPLPQGTYYLRVSIASGVFATPFDYRVRTSTGPFGGTSQTVSCNGQSGYCEEVTGTLTLGDVQAYQDNCWGGDVYAAGPCPASTLAGYCDGGASIYGSSTLHWIYYAPAYDQGAAESSCVGWGNWVGGLCSAPTPNACTLGTRSFCADLANDPSNCGACGTVCEPGSTCSGSVCSTACGTTAGYAVCGTTELPVCVDTNTSQQNCGSCGVDCGTQACEGGFCHATCSGPGVLECLDATTGYSCVDTLNDTTHCGGCAATTCDTCVNGQCGATVACENITLQGFCTQLSGTFTAGEYAAAKAECTNAGGTVPAGLCPAGAVPGYCDAGIPAAYPGAIGTVHFYAPTYSSPSAQAICLGGANAWVPEPLPAVGPLLPINGANWNDWVQGNSLLDVVDSPCDPVASPDCVHAGEIRSVLVPGASNCVGLVAVDALGAFDWSCGLDPISGEVRFSTLRLKGFNTTTFAPEVRLAQLIDESTLQWRPNAVTVYTNNGATYFSETPATVWWPNNPIAPLPASGQLDAPGTLYVAGSTSPQVSVQITASRVGLVIMPGTVLRPLNPSMNAVKGSLSDFLWIEGAIDASTSDIGLLLSNVRRSSIRSLSVTRDALNVGPAGVHLVDSTGNRIRFVVSRNSGWGLRLERSNGNNLREIEASSCYTGISVDSSSSGNELRLLSLAANASLGLDVSGSDDNEFVDVTASNNAVGVRLWGALRTRMATVTVANNLYAGLQLDSAKDSRLVDVTASLNRDTGIHFLGSDANVLVNAVAFGSAQGMALIGSSSNTIVDLAVSDASAVDLLSGGTSTDNRFLGTLLTGPYGIRACEDGGSTTAGFDNDPALPESCSPNGASMFVPEGIVSLASSFVPRPLAAPDAVNRTWSGASLSLTDLGEPLMDWTGFQNGFRAWGPAAANGPMGCNDPTIRTQSACQIAGRTWSDPATLYDWSLAAGVDPFLHPLLERWPVPDGSSLVAHTWSDFSTSTFLRHGMERDIVGLGNNDCLCEWGEYCYFTPNFGAYQGHGTIMSVGQVLGGPNPITLSRYTTNGY